mmetsp:Transcript_13370/g.31917  ORF Transcript_13370/g.31917 Transcript_13370/m.31917 type:complete len:215 (+) Transcript_13370:559-1203(+)
MMSMRFGCGESGGESDSSAVAACWPSATAVVSSVCTSCAASASVASSGMVSRRMKSFSTPSCRTSDTNAGRSASGSESIDDVRLLRPRLSASRILEKYRGEMSSSREPPWMLVASRESGTTAMVVSGTVKRVPRTDSSTRSDRCRPRLLLLLRLERDEDADEDEDDPPDDEAPGAASWLLVRSWTVRTAWRISSSTSTLVLFCRAMVICFSFSM